MAQCNRSAVYIQPFLIELQIAIAGDDLCGEGFVEFDQIDVCKRKLLAFRTVRVAGTGPMPMISGGTPTIS